MFKNVTLLKACFKKFSGTNQNHFEKSFVNDFGISLPYISSKERHIHSRNCQVHDRVSLLLLGSKIQKISSTLQLHLDNYA